MIDLEVLSIDSPIEEPPKRWRLWFTTYVKSYSVCDTCGVRRELEITVPNVVCCKVFPSKDAAETAHAEQVARFSLPWWFESLGAYAEGERPSG